MSNTIIARKESMERSIERVESAITMMTLPGEYPNAVDMFAFNDDARADYDTALNGLTVLRDDLRRAYDGFMQAVEPYRAKWDVKP